MKLPKKIYNAILHYYYNRSRQYKISYSNSYDVGRGAPQIIAVKSGVVWDKEASLAAIRTACIAHGWGFQACAGTFWLFPKNVTHCHYEVDENTFPNLKKVANSKKKI